MESKLYFRLWNQTESDICYWLKQGYRLVAVVPHGESSRPDHNTAYHFIHRDCA